MLIIIMFVLSNTFFLGLRVEWAKSRARAIRWSEEVTLLVEEMRRVLWFLRWKKLWWMDHAHMRTTASPEVNDGLLAYSAKQAGILHNMAMHFADEWYPILIANGFCAEWPLEYVEGRSDMPREILPLTVVEDSDMLVIEDDIFD